MESKNYISFSKEGDPNWAKKRKSEWLQFSLSVASPFLSTVSLSKILLHLQLLVIPLVQLILLPPLNLIAPSPQGVG